MLSHLLVAAGLFTAPAPHAGEGDPSARLRGRWRLVSVELGGKPMSPGGLYALHFTTDRVFAQEEVVDRGTAREEAWRYTLGAGRTPLFLDWGLVGKCASSGIGVDGLCRFTGDRLVVVKGPQGEARARSRPSTFQSDAPGTTRYEWRRERADDIAWGRPVGGIRFGLTLTRADRTYHVGETVTWVVVAENVGPKQVHLHFPRMSQAGLCYLNRCWPTLHDARGSAALTVGPWPPKGALAPPEMVEFAPLPGQPILLGSASLLLGTPADRNTAIGAPVAPGEYRLGYERFLPVLSGSATGSLSVTVRPAR